MRIAGTVAALSALFLLLVLAAPHSRTPRAELLAVRARQTALAEEAAAAGDTPDFANASPLSSKMLDTAAVDDVLGSLAPTYDVSSVSLLPVFGSGLPPPADIERQDSSRCQSSSVWTPRMAGCSVRT